MPKVRIKDVEREYLDDGECFMHHRQKAPCKKCQRAFCSDCSLNTYVPGKMNASEFCVECRDRAYEDDLAHDIYLDEQAQNQVYDGPVGIFEDYSGDYD